MLLGKLLRSEKGIKREPVKTITGKGLFGRLGVLMLRGTVVGKVRLYW